MKLHSRVLSIGVAVSAWMLVSGAGSAIAQSEPPKENVLGGPKVKDNSVPGAKSRFSAGKGDKKERALDRGIPPGVYMKALDVLRDGAAESVRLTSTQDEKIRDIQREFIDSERAYMREHLSEVRELRKDMPPEMRKRVDERLKNAKAFEKGLPKDGVKKDKKGAPPPPPPPSRDEPMQEMDEPMKDGAAPDAAATARARDRIEEIFNGAPKPKDAQSKVWALLTEVQRPVLQAEIERLQKDGQKGRGLEGPSAELRDKLKNMTPEERKKALEEMREKRAAKRPQDGEPKPAPSHEDVDVPRPK